MLATGGQAQGFGGIGRQLEEPAGQALGIKEFARLLRSAACLQVGIARILGVDRLDGRLKCVHVFAATGTCVKYCEVTRAVAKQRAAQMR